jgi:peroxiredoxin
MASRTDNAGELLKNLPVPEDDGAADGLEGSELPPVALTSTAGGSVDLSALPGTTVVYCYPMTGGPDGDVPDGWDDIPGARGCTPQSCAFRDHHAELSGLGARVFGLSTQGTDYQREAARRLRLPYELLSDEGLAFVRGVGLPTFEVEGTVLTKRLTMILKEGRIEKVFYPVFPPDRNAEEVIGWLSARATS